MVCHHRFRGHHTPNRTIGDEENSELSINTINISQNIELISTAALFQPADYGTLDRNVFRGLSVSAFYCFFNSLLYG